MDLLTNLNPAQRLAVTTTEGPVMVMAGAGSGKTKVLTTRISYIIKELKVIPSKILAVTFTNKAALEMKKRVADMLDINTDYMWVSTFHSFCARLLRMEIDAMPPYNKKFTILDEEDSIRVIRKIISESNREFETTPKEFKKVISKNKNNKDYSVNIPSIEDFMYVNQKYEEKCKKDNLLDFDDLIIKTIELFTKNPKILEKYQNQFEYILVDEFQDTNEFQYDLMTMLSSKHRNLFVVGDDFQSIYSFRGAKIENIRKLQQDYQDIKLILLEQNYRSTSQILNLANDVIENNPNQIKKVMFSTNKEGVLPKYYNASTAEDEVNFVQNIILEGVRKGKKYSDFAIMYRASFISNKFEQMLIRNGIPYVVYGGLPFYSRKEIKDIIAYLRVLIHHNDNFSFQRIINVPKRKIGDKIFESLSIKAEEKSLSLYDAIDFFSGNRVGIKNLYSFKEKMDDLSSRIEEMSLKDLVDEIYDAFSYENELKNEEETFHDRLENIEELKKELEKEKKKYPKLSNFDVLDAFLLNLELMSDDENHNSIDSLCLTTFHQAKGLEFDTVFMVAMEEDVFPSVNAKTEKELEEERRICYVGITRAKKELYLSSSKKRWLYIDHMLNNFDGERKKSRFIDELVSEHYFDMSKPKPRVNLGESTTFASFTYKKEEKKKEEVVSDISYKIGDKINHKAFGDGLVVQVSGSTITVAFKAPYGVKVLNGNHPSIRKI